MSRSVRNFCCWGLVVLSSLLSLGNSAGLVLCIENDGSMAIESPAEQAECRHRHDLAAGLAATRAGEHATETRATNATYCVDIPLTVAASPVLVRPMSDRIVPVERFGFAAICDAPSVVGSPWSLDVSQARMHGRSPPSSVLAALQNIVLLV